MIHIKRNIILISLTVLVLALVMLMISVALLSGKIGDMYYTKWNNSKTHSNAVISKAIILYEIDYTVFGNSSTLTKMCNAINDSIIYGNEYDYNYSKVKKYFSLVIQEDDIDHLLKMRLWSRYIESLFYTDGVDEYMKKFEDDMHNFDSIDILSALDPLLFKPNVTSTELEWVICKCNDMIIFNSDLKFQAFVLHQQAFAYHRLGNIDKADEIEKRSSDIFESISQSS